MVFWLWNAELWELRRGHRVGRIRLVVRLGEIIPLDIQLDFELFKKLGGNFRQLVDAFLIKLLLRIAVEDDDGGDEQQKQHHGHQEIDKGFDRKPLFYFLYHKCTVSPRTKCRLVQQRSRNFSHALKIGFCGIQSDDAGVGDTAFAPDIRRRAAEDGGIHLVVLQFHVFFCHERIRVGVAGGQNSNDVFIGQLDGQQTAAAPEPLLEVKDLSFGYQKGQPTLKHVSFSIGKGEMVSIVGRNGAGKSTLAKLICGFETPDSGDILLNGKSLADENIRHRAKHIGYVMQNPNQMISKTMIFDEVALGLQRSGLSEAEIREKVEKTLKVCGLYPFRNWPVSALSFGQKKRVTIASVLVLDPELILLDEPTAGQDFHHYTDIMEFLRGLNAQGVTVVMITHDMHLMLEYTPRALAFCDGQLIADRTAAGVLCDPELVEQAALKETSLYTLANRCGIEPAQEFVERFIAQDREVRENGR